MNCKNCSIELHESANFCFNCGTKVEKHLNCADCDEVLVNGARFCSNCGKEVLKQKAELQSSQTVELLNEFDEENPEEIVKNWYGKYFDYVGDFVDGYAPVFDSVINPQYVGYVPEEIPQKLKEYVIKKTDCNALTILLHIEINKQLLNLYGSDRVKWVGEFRNGQAFMATESSIFTIDTQGNIEEVGGIKFKSEEAILAYYGHYEIIINFKGDIIRKSDSSSREYIYPLKEKNLAIFGKYDNFSSKEKVGLLVIPTGRELLKQSYDELTDEECILPDGTRKYALITKKTNAKGVYYGCLDVHKGWIFKTKYPSIEMVKTEDDFWKDGLLLICLSEDDEGNETKYRMAIADITGEILFEYTTYNTDYTVIDGKVYVYIKNSDGVDVVGIDNKILVSCPGASIMKYLGEGYFSVTNTNSQWALMNVDGEYTIPFGKFDELHSYRIHSGAIKVEKDNLWGIVDVKGNVLIPLMYENIRDEYTLSEEPTILVYPVQKEVGWFYINYRNETDFERPAREYITKKLSAVK